MGALPKDRQREIAASLARFLRGQRSVFVCRRIICVYAATRVGSAEKCQVSLLRGRLASFFFLFQDTFVAAVESGLYMVFSFRWFGVTFLSSPLRQQLLSLAIG